MAATKITLHQIISRNNILKSNKTQNNLYYNNKK